jgi:hypothetical protein
MAERRICCLPGSFFTEPLPKADVTTMGHILHDWNLEEKRMLIRKAYEALPEGGALLVYDTIIDDDRQKRLWPHDEPANDDRNSRRVRLHRR